MKIGLIADIHANYTALEAVLEDMPDVDSLVCLGDVVGYNPNPKECVEKVTETCDLVLRGNHDRNVRTPGDYRHNEMAYEGLKHARKELTEGQIDWLEQLPDRKDIFDTGFKSAHSHPDPDMLDKYVMPAEFPNLRRYLDDYEGIFLAHTHVQHEAVIDDRLILNPGSVGQPRDNDERAAYAVVDTESKEADLCRTEYDIDSVIEEVNEEGLPKRTGERLRRGE
jgi:predicted phosphodiesterase